MRNVSQFRREMKLTVAKRVKRGYERWRNFRITFWRGSFSTKKLEVINYLLNSRGGKNIFLLQNTVCIVKKYFLTQ